MDKTKESLTDFAKETQIKKGKFLFRRISVVSFFFSLRPYRNRKKLVSWKNHVCTIDERHGSSHFIAPNNIILHKDRQAVKQVKIGQMMQNKLSLVKKNYR